MPLPKDAQDVHVLNAVPARVHVAKVRLVLSSLFEIASSAKRRPSAHGAAIVTGQHPNVQNPSHATTKPNAITVNHIYLIIILTSINLFRNFRHPIVY